jgi:hypothetical protein
MSRKYDHADFVANPRKYQLYTSADVARNLFGENGADVPAGTPVGVKFIGVRRNQLYKRDEPVYQITTGHVVYANALSSFVL